MSTNNQKWEIRWELAQRFVFDAQIKCSQPGRAMKPEPVLAVRYRPIKQKGRFASFNIIGPYKIEKLQSVVEAYNKKSGPLAWRDL